MFKAQEKFFTNKRCSQGGYSLIGMTLFVVVAGILVAGGLFLAKQYGYSQKLDATNGKIARIEEALKNYRALNGYLPCPADIGAGTETASFGRATSCYGAGASGIESPLGRANERVHIGSVPVRSLNIPDELMVDEWGSRFVYAVSDYYTNPSVTAKPDFAADKGAITMIDMAGTNMTPATPGGVLYTVISLGPDRRGARNLAGHEKEACPASGPSAENCDMANATFRSSISKQFDVGSDAFTANVKYATAQQAYRWVVNDWVPCSCSGTEASNNPVQTRVSFGGTDTIGNTTDGMKCVNATGEQVEDSRCAVIDRPAASQSCVAFCVVRTSLPSCTCSNIGTTQTNSVTCERRYGGEGIIVANVECGNPTADSVACTDTGWCNSCVPSSNTGSAYLGGGGSSSETRAQYDTDGDGRADSDMGRSDQCQSGCN